MPVHITVRFIDGKIVEDFRYFNNAEINMDLMRAEQETAKAEAEDEAAMIE